MSLGIVIKGPEGLVLAAESRLTLEGKVGPQKPIHVSFDNATKLLSFSEPNMAVGVVTYGIAVIGDRTAHSFIPEFEAGLSKERLPMPGFCQELSDFYMKQWEAAMPANYKGINMTFAVGGFNEGEPYGRVFLFDVPANPKPVERHAGPREFGIAWGGQREIVDRLVTGFDLRLLGIVGKQLGLKKAQVQALRQDLGQLELPIPLPAMPLQDCVDLAIFFIRTTITAQKLTVGLRGCGGPIDVATVTRRKGLRFIQRKEVVGEITSRSEALERRI